MAYSSAIQGKDLKDTLEDTTLVHQNLDGKPYEVKCIGLTDEGSEIVVPRYGVCERYEVKVSWNIPRDSHTGTYLTNCYDNLYKINRFVDFCKIRGQMPYAGMMESMVTELKTFRAKLWKPFRDRLANKYGANAIGTIECTGQGMLHIHFLVLFPDHYSAERIAGQISADLRDFWKITHQRVLEIPLKGERMGLEAPRDGDGYQYGLYAAKAFKNGPIPQKWGKKRNQSYLLKANLEHLALWKRDDLPSRRMSRAKAVEAALRIFGYVDWAT